jgi:hypothetical protein
MDAYDTSIESLRARVAKVAEEYSQQLRRIPGSEVAFFIGDIVNAAENVVGDVVNAAHDAVNAAVNATQNVVNAAENVVNNVAHAAQNITHNIIHATEDAIHAVTDHTQFIIQTAQLTAATFRVTLEATDLIGGLAAESQGGQKTPAADRPSVTQLIQARRAAILQERTSLVNNALAKRAEIKNGIDSVRNRLGALLSRGPST